MVFPLAVAGRHDPATGRTLDGEHVPTPARLDKEELFSIQPRGWSGQREDGGELGQLLGCEYQRQPVYRGKCLEGQRNSPARCYQCIVSRLPRADEFNAPS